MSDDAQETIEIKRPKRSIALTSFEGLLSLFKGGPLNRTKSLTAGISKYTRHQGNKEMERRRRKV